MSYLSSPVSGAVMDFNPFKTRTESDASHQLGGLIVLSDERKFRYGKVGASNVSKGKLQQDPAHKANHDNMSCDATANGEISVNVTPGATAVVANEYAEGYLVINDVDGEGQTYKVSGHAAADASTEFAVKLYDAIDVALTANSQASLIHNKFNGVVEVASKTRRPVGVPMIDLVAGDYGWFQSAGVAGVLIGTAATLGGRLTSDGSTAGAVTDNTDVTTVQTEVQVGWANLAAGTSTEYNPITLQID